jgi:hypothetical protein
VNFRPIQSLRRLRHPIFTPLCAISLLLLLLTLATWLAAALFPHSRFVVNWTDAGSHIDVSADCFGWNRYGYYFQHVDNEYGGQIAVWPGHEDDPILQRLAQQQARRLQSVRDKLFKLTPPNSHVVLWRTNTPYLQNLLPYPVMGGLSLGSYGEQHGFGGWLTLFALLPLLWLTVAAWGYHRRKHRRPPGSCPTCGYDLRASPTCCPECGTPVRRLARVA